MYDLERLSNDELHRRTVSAGKDEQNATLVLLRHLHEVNRRKLFAAQSFGTLWEYVVKALGFSEVQASERIAAMRFMFRVREAQVALESGTLNLTQAAMVERHLRAEEKELQSPVPKPEIKQLLSEIQGCSKRETEQILLSSRPSETPVVREKLKAISIDTSEIRFPISEDTREAMQRFWELKGKCSMAEMFSTCLKFYLAKKDPNEKIQAGNKNRDLNGPDFCSPVTSKEHKVNKEKLLFPEKALQEKVRPKRVLRDRSVRTSRTTSRSRYIPAAIRREILQKAHGQCEFIDPRTNRRCESRYLLQIDHVQPHALGGGSENSNLRILCAVHNQFLATTMYACEQITAYG